MLVVLESQAQHLSPRVCRLDCNCIPYLAGAYLIDDGNRGSVMMLVNRYPSIVKSGQVQQETAVSIRDDGHYKSIDIMKHER